MATAFLIGGNGQIGQAIARALCRNGWTVHIGARSGAFIPDLCNHIELDRTIPGALSSALGDGADLLVDCVGFSKSDAQSVLDVQGSVGRIATISSASVYCDDHGRSLDEAKENGFPHYPVPIPETHQTVAPGPQTYSTRKVAMEHHLLAGADVPVTVLRPCAIHGAFSKHAREWWVVKRLLDGRARIPLRDGGKSQFQTTSVEAIAEILMAAMDMDAPQILNVVDADAPDVAQIAKTIMRILGLEAELVDVPSDAPALLGHTPWSVERPLICASSLPGSRSYAETVGPALDWLVDHVDLQNWKSALPQLATYPRDHFDYTLEDALWMAEQQHSARAPFVSAGRLYLFNETQRGSGARHALNDAP